MSAERSVGEPVLVLVSPTALALDGESVRVAKDVLGAALRVKAVVPESMADLERLLARRGRRRPVVIGDDRALQAVVQLLHQQESLGTGPLGVIPVGRGHRVELARALGVETRAVEAARAVVNGTERRLDLLVDDDGGVVLDAVRIPGQRSPRANRVASTWWTELSRRVARVLLPLRVEADGEVLAEPSRPVRALALALRSSGGAAELRITAERGHGSGLTIPAQRVTVAGELFTYEADHARSAEVRERTWTVEASAWSVCVPR